MNDQELGAIKIGLQLDAIEATKSIKNFNNQIATVKSELVAAGDGTKKYANSLEGLRNKNENLGRQLELQKAKLKELKRQHEEAASAEKVNEDQVNKLAAQYNRTLGTINKLESQMQTTTQKINDQSSEWTQLKNSASASVIAIDGKLKTLESRFKASTAGIENFGKSEEHAFQQTEHLNSVLELQGRKVEALKGVFDHLRRTKGEDAEATQKAEREYNSAVAAFKKTESALNGLNNDLNRNESQWDKTAKAISEAEEKVRSFGEKTKGVGESASKMSIPIVAAGAAMGKVAMDADSASASIQASLGVTGAEADRLTGKAQNVWKRGFGEDMNDAKSALIQVKQNIKGLNDGDLEEVTKNSLVLGQVFDADVNEVTRAGANIMKGFGEDSKHSFDLMAYGAQNGLNFSNEMFDNLSEYAPLFGKMGFSADEYFQLLIKGSKAGVYNLDYINDAVKEFQIRIKDGSKSTRQAMDQMSESTIKVWQDMLEGKATVKEVHNAVIADLKGMKDQTKANELGVAVYGTKWEDLEADAMYAMGNIDGGLKNVDGSMKKASDAMEQSFGQQARATMREFGAALAPLGLELLEMARDILPDVKAATEKITEVIQAMSPEARKAAVMVGGFAAAFGPLVMGMGSMISSGSTVIGLLGRLAPLFAGAGGAAAGTTAAVGGTTLALEGTAVAAGGAGAALGGGAGLAGVLGVLTGPVGWAALAIAGLTAGGVLLAKHLKQDSIPAVNLFGDKISESTKKAVGGYMKLNNDATVQLNLLKFSSEKISKETADSVKSKFSQMGDQILTKMKSDDTKRIAQMTSFFSQSKALSNKEEQEILNNAKKKNEEKQKAIKDGEARINKIFDDAAKKNKKITSDQWAEIDKIQKNMTKEAVKTLSKNEVEQKSIMERMKRTSGDLSARQAAEVVKQSKKATDGAIKEADTKYKKTVAWAIRERDENKTISKEKADKIIDDAKKMRDKSVKHAEDTQKEVIKQAKKQSKGHVKEVDWERGEVKSKWESMTTNNAKSLNLLITALNLLLKGLNIPVLSLVPIPKFKDGTDGHAGGPAIVGDGKKPELILEPSGKSYLSPATDTLIPNMPKGTKVLSGEQTEDYFKNQQPAYYKKGNVLENAASAVGNWAKETGGKVVDGAKSVGGKVADKAGDAAGWVKGKFGDAEKMVSKAMDDPLGVVTSVFDKFKPYKLGMHLEKVMPAVYSKVKASISDKVKSAVDAMSFFGDSGSGIGSYYLNKPFRISTHFTPNGNSKDKVHKGGVHKGLDLAAPLGTTIKSLTDGIVQQVLIGSSTAGNGVRVKSGSDLLSYIHMMQAPNVKQGQKVKEGQTLGFVGSTGFSTGPHLDLKIQRNGKYIDPLKYLQGASGGGGPSVKGGAAAWRSQIIKAAQQMHENPTAGHINGIIAQIQRESGGNQKITQSSKLRDINVRNGNPARGLLQYIPQSFMRYAVKGHTSIYNGFDQLLAWFNNTNWKKDLRYGKSGWGPTGRRKYANGGIIPSHSVFEGGEEGPEMIIPLVNKRRDRAIDLWFETGKMLGMLGLNENGEKDSNNPTVTNNQNVSNVYNIDIRVEGSNASAMTSNPREFAKEMKKELEALEQEENRYGGVYNL